MKKLISFCFLFSISLPLWSGELKDFLHQTEDALHQEIRQTDALPASLIPEKLPALRLSNHLNGALAEYQESRKSYVSLSRQTLKQWKKRLSSRYNSPQLPLVFAWCLLPVYVHELSHARDQRQARSNGFVWPVTLEDEYIATWWQLYLLQNYFSTVPDYRADCKEWLPPQVLFHTSADQWKDKVYLLYGERLGIALPPPISAQNLMSLRQNGQIVFEELTYRPKSRKLRWNTFVKQGGNWLFLSPAALERLASSQQYAAYLKWLQRREKETKSFVASPLLIM